MKLGIFDKYKTTLGQINHVKKVLSDTKPTAINFEIDLTNGCNHRCSFCQWGSYLESNRATLKSKIVLKTLPELINYGTKAITWTGGGEPAFPSRVPAVGSHPWSRLPKTQRGPGIVVR